MTKPQIDISKAVAAKEEMFSFLGSLSPEVIVKIDDILGEIQDHAEEFFVIRGYDPTSTKMKDAVIFLEPSEAYRKWMAELRIRAAEAA